MLATPEENNKGRKTLSFTPLFILPLGPLTLIPFKKLLDPYHK
jgi:hypothetical protein